MERESVKVDIQRTGFFVSIGVLEFWFDSSLEGLRQFFNVEKIAQEKLQEAEELAQHIHFPEEIGSDLEDVDIENVDKALDLHREYIAVQYDIVLGEGAFKTIYSKYPDILSLENAFDPLCFAIAERIEEQEKERIERVEEKKREYLEKKRKKG